MFSMKLLVATRADSNIKAMTDITHPLIQSYCKKIGADFKVLAQDSECKEGKRKNHYRITAIKELLEEYDRVLSIDSDVVINKTCPDIFKETPEDCIGTIFEDKGSRAAARHSRISKIQGVYGDVGWRTGYINTGVFVVSKNHKNIFNSINDSFWLGEGEDDVHIGFNIHKLNLKIHELSFKWNHMTMFSEGWNNCADRFSSFIIHYAGQGKFNQNSRLSQIKFDKEKIWGVS